MSGKNFRLTADGKIFRYGRKRYPNGDLYQGEFVDGLREGRGQLEYANGNVYQGEWKSNMFHGFGVMSWGPFSEGDRIITGRRYEGNYERGMKCGEGLLLLGQGDKYEGCFKDDMYHGPGKMTKGNGDQIEGIYAFGNLNGYAKIRYANGNRYDGEFIAGHFHGKGKFVYDSRWPGWYEGEYRHGKQHGRGTRVFANNNRYEGQFQFGDLEGEGIMEFANGNQYVGSWKGGAMDGRGVLQYANGDRYEGEFCKGFFYGRGRFQYADGGYFEGEYVKTKGGYEHGVRFPDPDGRRNGHGVRVWVTGDKYEGQWSDNLMHGAGIVRKASGGKFEGTFRWGKKMGYGKETWGNTLNIQYTCPLGFRHEGRGFCSYEGYFTDGHFHGHGCFSTVDGRQYDGQWRRGRRHGWGSCIMAPLDERGDPRRQFMGGIDGMYRIYGYIGEWDDGRRTGKGTIEYPGGVRVTGEFVDGKCEGEAKYTFEGLGTMRRALFRGGSRVQWLGPAEEDPDVANASDTKSIISAMFGNREVRSNSLESGDTTGGGSLSVI